MCQETWWSTRRQEGPAPINSESRWWSVETATVSHTYSAYDVERGGQDGNVCVCGRARSGHDLSVDKPVKSSGRMRRGADEWAVFSW